MQVTSNKQQDGTTRRALAVALPPPHCGAPHSAQQLQHSYSRPDCKRNATRDDIRRALATSAALASSAQHPEQHTDTVSILTREGHTH
eukprot:scaffold14319_cov154-Isochrysis_galbana.AAC.2